MKLAITPLQRWNLRELAYGDKAPKVKGGQEGRRLRRFCRHLGITPITAAVIAGNGKVSSKQVVAQTPSLFELDDEDRDRILSLAELERTPSAEDVLGPLFDACEDWKAARDVATPEGVADYDAASEDWLAPPEGTEDETPE